MEFRTNTFANRHIGPSATERASMLGNIGYKDMPSLITDCIPKNIHADRDLNLDNGLTETEALDHLQSIIEKNKTVRSLIGMGYYGTHVPNVIKRCVLENPGWYTQYTPYQAEIAQGRLEALINFQTMVAELTGLPIANASLLDEGTAAAEAMIMAFASRPRKSESNTFAVSEFVLPQTKALLETRAQPLGIELSFVNESSGQIPSDVFGVLLSYPHSRGGLSQDMKGIMDSYHQAGATVCVTSDLLALCLLKSPGSLGADIVVGSTQRFGVPMGFGGPHAGFMATKDEFKRKIPGRIVGVSKDKNGKTAYRLSLQTREQHIRRDKATSNICTSQVLLAIMASMYAVYHGPKKLKALAENVHKFACRFKSCVEKVGLNSTESIFFDTVTLNIGEDKKPALIKKALEAGFNFRTDLKDHISVSFDECTTEKEFQKLLKVFNTDDGPFESTVLPKDLIRDTPYMEQPVFNSHHTETQMLRYIKTLEGKDLSLAHSMIPLGSCTMKLNSASSLYPVSWPKMANIHPFAPSDQTVGYLEMIDELENMLAVVTGFDAVSIQPNSGAQGEYAGLLTINAYHQSRGDENRKICLIPTSAHGTNPASAVMAGLKVVPVKCDDEGNIDLEDLRTKAEKHKDELSSLMITYPSTHGVFEETIREICNIVHDHGGQVYLDGANLNAQVGFCYPGEYGADVCHLNLHKTFSIPHGGGGPGVGPIGVKSHLQPFLPGHPMMASKNENAIGPVSAAPYGSAGILCIPWMYLKMLGKEGLRESTECAILNANYLASRLKDSYTILYKGQNERVAHECIIDLRPFKKSAGIEVEDIAKRLMDYGFHAPTISWPVAGTMMIEPTESESKDEIDRFCEAMISIRSELKAIESAGNVQSNLIKNAPHTQDCIVMPDWTNDYSRESAVFPAPWVRLNKFWPSVARIDNAHGDRNLVCTCPSMEEFS